jgi:hypothetical protein
MRTLFKSCLAAGAGLWLGLSGAAFADTPVTYSDNGRALFQVSVPDFWSLRTGGDRVVEDTKLGDARAVSRIMAMRPVTEEGVWMGLVSPNGVSTLSEGLAYLADIEKFMTKEPEITSTLDTRIGGLPAKVVRARGRRDGRGVNITATVIDLPGARVAVAVAVLADNVDPAFADELNDVLASFRAKN